MFRLLCCAVAVATLAAGAVSQDERRRARDLGIVIGQGKPGSHNAITDVPGVHVGHETVREGDDVRTGVTVVLPHGDNPFRSKVPAAIVVENGYGKLAGSTQVQELGELESPIALTNTLNVGLVLDALVEWSLEQPGNERVRSVNCVVGETNDGRLNDIRGRHVKAKHVLEAIQSAQDESGAGSVPLGAVGAGTGTVCFGWKGGIGSASRKVPGPSGSNETNYTVGVLVQSNFGGSLSIGGVSMADLPRPGRSREEEDEADEGADGWGSCMIVVATDAPLSSRNLERLAKRAFAGMARTGASFSNGSGDYAIAFSNAPSLRRAPGQKTIGGETLGNDAMTPLFVAVAEATEEATLDSMLMAETTTGNGRTVHALPIPAVLERMRR